MSRKARSYPFNADDYHLDEMYPRQGETIVQALHREFLAENVQYDLESHRIRRFVFGFAIFVALYITYKLDGEKIEVPHDHHADMIAEAKKNGCYGWYGGLV